MKQANRRVAKGGSASIKVVIAGVLLMVVGIAYGHHCAGYGYWLGSGGGYVGGYVEQKWENCIAAVGRKDSFEEWVGAQYRCVGTYYKRNSTTQTVYVRIYRCNKTSATAGYCYWGDVPEGSPTGHSDSVTATHYCSTCSAGYHWTGLSACVLGSGDGSNYGAPNCEGEGNPIHARTGNKFQKEVDYLGRGPFPLKLERSYNSFIGFSSGSVGPYWRHGYDRVLKINNYGSFGTAPYQWINSPAKVLVVRPDGRELNFTATIDASTSYQVPEGTFLTAAPVVTERLQKTATGFRLFTSDDGIEDYNASGLLQSVADRHGRVHSLVYGANGRLWTVEDPFGKKLVFEYNAQGRLWKLTDPAGGVTEYGYDTSGRLTTVLYPDAKTRTYLYQHPTIAHLLTGIIDENGQQFATYTYGSQGRAATSEYAGGAGKVSLIFNADGTTTVTDAIGTQRVRSFANAFGFYRSAGSTVPCASCGTSSQTVTYDAAGFVDTRTDFNGNVTDYAYNARGLEESRTEAYGTVLARTISTQWHPAFRVPTQIDEPGRQTVMTYDDVTGNRLSETVTDTATSESRMTIWTYNGQGQVLTVNGPRTDVNDVTTYSYYECATGAECGQVHTITNPLGQVTEVTSYDEHGNPLTIVDPNGVPTTLTYDARQRLKTRTVAGSTTTFDYDGVGQLDKVTLPGGALLDYTYDAAHRLTDIEDNFGNRIHYTLDGLGNRKKEEVFDPAGVLKRTQRQAFNSLGRLHQIRNAADQLVTVFGYDNNGNRTSRVDYSDLVTSHTTEFVPDALNRTKLVTDAADGETIYGYNALDQLESVTDARGLTTGYSVNALGDVLHQESPDTGITDYSYDAAGNRKTQTDARGVLVTYGYDALNRLTSVDYPGTAEDVSYAYDGANYAAGIVNGIGRLTGITDGSGTTTILYDVRGNVTQETKVIGGTTYVTGYGYDAADRLVGITYPTGRLVSYERDAAGRIARVTTTVGGVTSTVADAITYLPFGGIKGYTLGNGVVVTRAFDDDYRVTEISDQGTNVVQHLDLELNLRDDIEEIDDRVDAGRWQTFDYDELSRLTFAHGQYGDRAYTYDAVGNRLSEAVTPPEGTLTAVDYTYPATNHRLTSLTDGTTLTYDDAGAVEAKGILSLTYNNAHRASAIASGGTIVQNLYNAAGQRSRKTVAGEHTTFHYDRNGLLLAETGEGGMFIQREYVWLEGIPLSVDAEVYRVTSVVDNSDSGFASSGGWTASTSAAGYYGVDYVERAPMGEPAGTLVLDDLDSGTSKTGVWLPLSGAPPGYQGVGYQRSGFSLTPNAFTWSLPLVTPGEYRVYVRWVSDPSFSTQAQYTVTHATGTATVSVDQTVGGGAWYLLGSYSFMTTAQISLTDPVGGTLVADAVRVIPVTGFADVANWSVPEGKTYEVYARWPAAAHHTERALYTVTHAAGASDVISDQTQGGGQWNLLGTYTFASPGVAVTLRADPEATTVADAIRFVPRGSSVTQATTAYVHADHLGTVQKMTDAAQQVVWQASYEPFGAASITKLPYFDNPLRFPGQYFDAETGLHQNWFRDYDPAIGRYLQSDPIGLAGGINTFTYVANNPLIFSDPLGLKTYQCTTPLHAVEDKYGKEKALWAKEHLPYMYHQYSCVVDKNGETTCGGQDRSGSALRSDGKPSQDTYKPEACEQTQPDNACFESCLKEEWAKPRPKYGIPFGSDCQNYDDDVNKKCRKKCNLK